MPRCPHGCWYPRCDFLGFGPRVAAQVVLPGLEAAGVAYAVRVVGDDILIARCPPSERRCPECPRSVRWAEATRLSLSGWLASGEAGRRMMVEGEFWNGSDKPGVREWRAAIQSGIGEAVARRGKGRGRRVAGRN